MAGGQGRACGYQVCIRRLWSPLGHFANAHLEQYASRMRFCPLLLIALVALPFPSQAAEPCARATALSSQVDALLAQGRLDRAARVLRKAFELCPSQGKDLRATLATTLVEVGRWAEARALAEAILQDSEAPAQVRAAAQEALQNVTVLEREKARPDVARELAKDAAGVRAASATKARELYLKAWRARHPNPEALLGAAGCARAEHLEAEAQRLFDRAAVDIESQTKAAPALEVSPLSASPLMALSADPQTDRVALGTGDGLVRLFDTHTGKVREEHAHAKQVASLAFGTRALASCALDGGLAFWDPASLKPVRPVAKGRACQAVFARAGGEFVAVREREGGLDLERHAADGSLLKSVALPGVHAGCRTSMSGDGLMECIGVGLSPDGKYLAASGGSDAYEVAKIFQVDDGALAATFQTHTAGFLSFSPTGRYFGIDGHMHSDWLKGGARERWDFWVGWPTFDTAFMFLSDTEIVIGNYEGRIDFTSEPPNGSLPFWTAHERPVTGLASLRGGKVLASSSEDASVRLWPMRSQELLGSVRFSRDGRAAAFVAGDGRVEILGEPSSLKLVCRAGNKDWPMEVCAERWRPTRPLLEALLAGSDEEPGLAQASPAR